MRTTVTRHLEWCDQRDLSTIYITNRRRTIARIDHELGKPLEEATAEDLAVWYRWLATREKPMQPQSRGIVLAHVKNYFAWLVREDIRADDPTRRLDRPRTHRGIPHPITDERLARALLDAPGRARPWLYLAAYAGLRAMEVASLRAEDVRRDIDKIVVRAGKGDKQRIVPLHPLIASVLDPDAYPAVGPLFPQADGTGPVKPHIVSRVCNRHLRSLGFADTLHSLRHYFASSVYRESRDLRLTQELMGHSSPATTAGYAAWSNERAAEVVFALGPHAA